MAAGVKKHRSEPARLASLFLAALATVLLFITVHLYTELSRKITNLDSGIREDSLWAVYQLDREARRVAVDLGRLEWAQGGSDTVKSLVLHYDILWSRVDLLTRSEYSRQLGVNDSFRHEFATVATMVRAHGPEFSAIGKAGSLHDMQAARLKVSFEDISARTERLLRDANLTVGAQRADRRAEVSSQVRLTEWMILALIGAVMALLALLRSEISTSRRFAAEAGAAAERLEEAWKAAEVANLAKSSFLATVSHEIRTPLNAIIGISDLLREQSLPQEALDDVDSIQRSGEMLLDILTQILDYSSVENGKMAFESRTFDAPGLVRECAGLFRLQAERKGVELYCSIDPQLRFVVSDPTRIRQILLNLVGNAVKFTAAGSVRVGAELRCESPGKAVMALSVTDTGAGIDAEGVKRLFKPFSQVDSAITRKYGGTGLGLSICKGVAEGLGGAVGVESEPGKGSRFWVEIPVAIGEAPASVGEQERVPPQLPRLSILLAEDNATNRMVATALLGGLGQNVRVACDGKQAVDLAAGEKFDLIFMDMQMPVLSGIDAARRIREGGGPNAFTPILAMTANASAEDRRACLDAGMDGFETKPVRRARLAELALKVAAGGFFVPERRIKAA